MKQPGFQWKVRGLAFFLAEVVSREAVHLASCVSQVFITILIYLGRNSSPIYHKQPGFFHCSIDNKFGGPLTLRHNSKASEAFGLRQTYRLRVAMRRLALMKLRDLVLADPHSWIFLGEILRLSCQLGQIEWSLPLFLQVTVRNRNFCVT